MEYSQGYVAFIDILGFSSYVSDESNGAKTNDLFRFIERFRDFYNESPKLGTEIAFFSDSIVITSTELSSIIIAVYIVESYLKKNLGLLFRGGICYGKYYHNRDITFGPAVVSAYELEKKALYSRIILDNQIELADGLELFVFTDIDGKKCVNPYCTLIEENASYGSDGPIYPDGDVIEIISDTFLKHRSELLEKIKEYKGDSVVEKYLWRIRPYNFTCNFFANMPCDTKLSELLGFTVNEKFKETINSLRITEADFELL